MTLKKIICTFLSVLFWNYPVFADDWPCTKDTDCGNTPERPYTNVCCNRQCCPPWTNVCCNGKCCPSSSYSCTPEGCCSGESFCSGVCCEQACCNKVCCPADQKCLPDQQTGNSECCPSKRDTGQGDCCPIGSAWRYDPSKNAKVCCPRGDVVDKQCITGGLGKDK